VLALHYLEELTLPEVADILGLPLGTVKSRLAYGLRQLRGRLGVAGVPGNTPHDKGATDE
jgi:RNA polymerase sigma-70 factor (ECF subfamily)